ncbi:MAG: hypothetical protein ACLR17_00810 [Enterobacteriaceae bacterium]
MRQFARRSPASPLRSATIASSSSRRANRHIWLKGDVVIREYWQHSERRRAAMHRAGFVPATWAISTMKAGCT